MAPFQQIIPTAILFFLLPTITKPFTIQKPQSKRQNPKNLPNFNPQTSKYNPPIEPTHKLYPLTGTLFRQGPLPILTRLTNPQKYEQSIYEYMIETQTYNLKTAQGNMDAFYAAPDVWMEQKVLEKRGEREVYDYGMDPPLERVVLASVWAVIVFGVLGRVGWQLYHGERNFF